MLTDDEKEYLKNIDPKKKVKIFPFSFKGKKIGDDLIASIKKQLPRADVLFMGSVVLGISGQKDIDIYILSKVEDFEKYLPQLEKLFGESQHKNRYIHKKFVEWKFEKNGYEIEVYLTEPPERQIKVFEILNSDKKILKEYEKLKLKYNGLSYKSYQKAKYEFFNRILSTAKLYIGLSVDLVIDRPLGSKHPKHGFIYEVNYGYVPDTKSPDGEELDAYFLGVDKPLKKATGKCIAVVHRLDDDDDKLIVVPDDVTYTDEEIDKQINFQEKWFKHKIIKK